MEQRATLCKGSRPARRPQETTVTTSVRMAEPQMEVMLGAVGHTAQGLTPSAERPGDKCKDGGVKGSAEHRGNAY